MKLSKTGKKVTTLILSAVLIAAFVPCYGSYAVATKSKLNDVSKQKENVYADIQKLNKEKKQQQKTIDSLEQTIKAKEADIAAAQEDLDKTKKRINKRKEGLNKRVRAMYKNGTVGYIDIILNSKDVSELIENVDMVQKIYKSDQKTLTSLKKEKAEIQAKEAKLQAEKQKLNTEQEKLRDSQNEISTVQAKLKSKYNTLNEQYESLRKALIAAEKAQQEAAKSSGSSSSGSYTYTGGTFHWPTVGGTITSDYGEKRSYENHPGIDIAVPTGTPIYAAASGVVVIAGSYGGYGYAVGISHGNGLFTVYGHNSRILVKVGQKVKRGQQIAKAGSTGWSTGPHCHFEVRAGQNGHTISPWKYLKR